MRIPIQLLLIACMLLSCVVCYAQTNTHESANAPYFDVLVEEDKEAYLLFLENKEVTVSSEGLTYLFVKRAEEELPKGKIDSQYTLHYRDKVITEVDWHDSSFKRGKPVTVNGIQAFHPAWKEALQMISAGDRMIFLQPPSQEKYLRDDSKGRLIVFEIEILEIKDAE